MMLIHQDHLNALIGHKAHAPWRAKLICFQNCFPLVSFELLVNKVPNIIANNDCQPFHQLYCTMREAEKSKQFDLTQVRLHNAKNDGGSAVEYV